MKTFVVYHFVHVRTPYRYFAKLFVVDVPDVKDADRIKSLLTRAGYEFGEFGMAWANHPVEVVDDDSPDEVIGALNRGDAETVTFSALQEKAGVTVGAFKLQKRQARDRLNKLKDQRVQSIVAVILQDYADDTAMLDRVEVALGRGCR